MATIEVGAWIHDKESLEVFLKKNTTATPQTSKEIAQTWSDAAKAKAFFSARVTSTDVLEEMRKAITWVVEGRATEGQAKAWIRDFFDTKGGSALQEMGYLPSNDTKKEGGNKITQLASATRIALIVDQNVRMSTAAKQWHDFQRNAWYEYVMYHTKEDGRVRNSHAMLDRRIWRKGDPAVKKVWPPQDFRCRCWMEPMWEEDLPEGAKITDGLPDGWQPADSGYTFDPEEWPFSLPPLKPSTPPDTAVEIKKEVEKAIIDKVLPPTIKPPVLLPIVDVTKPLPIIQPPVPVVAPVPVVPAPVPTPVKIKLTPEQKLDQTINVDLPKKLNEIENKYVKAEEKAKTSLEFKVKELENQMGQETDNTKWNVLFGERDKIKVKLAKLPQAISDIKIRLSEEAVIRSMTPHIGDFVKAKQLEDKSAQLPFSNKGLSIEERGKNADIRKEALDARRAFDKAREALGKRLLSVFGDQIPQGMTVDIQDEALKKNPYGDKIKNGIEASAKVAKSARFEGKRIIVRRSYRENEGASCRFGDIYLSEKYYEEDVTAHEFGHSVEFHEPDIDKKSREYLAYRAKGKELKKLADKYPNAGYDDDEMFYDGAFPQDYTGRIYKDGGTEVMSRGMEYFMTDVIGFALRDAGHFAFTLRQIIKARGGSWK